MPVLVAGFFMRGRIGRMPRFDLKSLLYSTALISLGLGVLYLVISPVLHGPSLYLGLLSLGIGPTIGAGLLLPFGRAWVGFALGLMVHAVRQFAFIWYFKERRLDSWSVAVILSCASISLLAFASRHYAARK